MSLTSYRAAPPRGEACRIRGLRPGPGGLGVREERGGLWSGLAVTYSPASMTAQYHQRLRA